MRPPGAPSHLAVLALVLVALVAGCARFTGDSTRFTLDRSQLQLDGERYVIVGVTAYLLPFYEGEPGAPDASLEQNRRLVDARAGEWFAAMHAHGFNTVRMPLTWQPDIMALYGYQPQEYAQRVRELVRMAHESGLTVILCWFDSTGLGAGLKDRYRDAFPAMKQIYTLVKDTPGVLLEPFNEPNDMDWPTWLRIWGDVVDFVRRDLEYDGVLIVDTIDYSWSFSPQAAKELQSRDRRIRGTAQLMFANHRYANTNTCFCGTERSKWESEVGRYTNDFPILGSEYGNYNEGMGPSAAWMRDLLHHLVTVAIPRGMNGAVAFVWHWVDPNSMTSSSGLELNDYGKQIVDDLVTPLTTRLTPAQGSGSP
jgi:hypothetical protein